MSTPILPFKQFFLDNFHTAVRFALFYVDDVSEAQDIAQDAFVRLYERWEELETADNLRSYLYVVLKHLSISRIRHQSVEEQFVKAELEHGNETEDTRFFEEVTYQETLRLLRHAIDGLPPQGRQIILLGLEGKNNTEIAYLMGISVNTVKTLKKNAYKTLRKSLGTLSEESLFLLLALLGQASA